MEKLVKTTETNKQTKRLKKALKMPQNIPLGLQLGSHGSQDPYDFNWIPKEAFEGLDVPLPKALKRTVLRQRVMGAHAG